VSSDLLAQLQTAQSDEERDWLVLQFNLARLEPAVQAAIWAAAIPHWFDAPFLAALLDQTLEVTQPLFVHLIPLSYVEPFPSRGYNIHERTRTLLLAHLWQADQARYREWSRRAADYSAQQPQEDIGCRIETVYHRLVADPDAGAAELQNLGWEWHNSPNFAYDKVEALARAAREHANAGRLAARGLGWTLFWEALLDYDYSRYLSAKDKFLQIHITAEEDSYLTADVAFRFGHVQRMLDEYMAAQEQYAVALALYRKLGARLGEANCLSSLGHVQRMLDEYATAQEQYAAALALYRKLGDRLGEANCLKALGDVQYRLDEYTAAQERYAAALALYRKLGARLGEANCLRALGDVQYRLDEYAAAQEQYAVALALYRKLGDRLGEANCLSSLGHVQRMFGEYAAAQEQYAAALALYRKLGARFGEINILFGFADLDRALARWAEATAKYEEALAYYQATGQRFNAALTLRRLGHTAKGSSDLAQARTYYQAALALFSQIGSPTAEKVQADLNGLEA